MWDLSAFKTGSMIAGRPIIFLVAWMTAIVAGAKAESANRLAIFGEQFAGHPAQRFEMLAAPRDERPAMAKTGWGSAALTRAEAAAAMAALWSERVEHIRQTRCAEMAARVVEADGWRMRFEMLSFTNRPAPEGRSLFLALHGGGGAPPAVNDSQWQNQIRLARGYRPPEGIYLAPRAPTDTWNLWHQAHIDALFARLIESLVVLSNVNPNRVYVFGYSAGGDGVYQIAPRTADRWAAAAMMAGHPNEASPRGLRNVPFAIHVGADDGGYKRNQAAADWGRRLDELRRQDPQGYIHWVELHAGKGHWMDLQDRKAIPWMDGYTRTPLPDKIVWLQDDVTHPQLYWLEVPIEDAKAGEEIVAHRSGQTVQLEGPNARKVTVLLNDLMLDLDQPVTIRAGGRTLFHGRAARKVATLERTLAARGDTNLAFSAEVTVTLP